MTRGILILPAPLRGGERGRFGDWTLTPGAAERGLTRPQGTQEQRQASWPTSEARTQRYSGGGETINRAADKEITVLGFADLGGKKSMLVPLAPPRGGLLWAESEGQGEGPL